MSEHYFRVLNQNVKIFISSFQEEYQGEEYIIVFARKNI